MPEMMSFKPFKSSRQEFGLFGGGGSKKQFLLFPLLLSLLSLAVAVGLGAEVRFSANSPPLCCWTRTVPTSAPLSSRYSIFKNLFDPHTRSLFFPPHRPPFLRVGIGRLYFPCQKKWKRSFDGLCKWQSLAKLIFELAL